MEYSYVLCLGSNVAEAESMLARATKELEREYCKLLRCSNRYKSGSGYLNQVLQLSSEFDPFTIRSYTKYIEQKLGRTPEMKKEGRVPIDIDVVMCDGEVLRPADYSAPYFQPGYHEIID